MLAVDPECSELDDTLLKLRCTNTNTEKKKLKLFLFKHASWTGQTHPSVQTLLCVCADCSDPRPSPMPSQHLESQTEAERRDFDGAQ